jgi:hypothetical protein
VLVAVDCLLKTGSFEKTKKQDRFQIDEKQEVTSNSDMGAKEH